MRPGAVVYDYPQGSNTGGYFYPRVRLPPGGYYYTTGVRVPPGTPTLPGQDYPPVLLPCQDTVTPHTQGGTPTLPGQDYPPVLLPRQGTITPHTQGGTSTLPGQDYPPGLLSIHPFCFATLPGPMSVSTFLPRITF